MKKRRQESLENRIYEAIGELEEEFELETDTLPEVIWLRKSDDLNKLGLKNKHLKYLQDLREHSRSCFIYESNLIILNDSSQEDIGEESSHFFHYNLSRIFNHKREKEETLLVGAIGEMIGFFGSLILDPSRKNTSIKDQDYFSVQKEYGIPFEVSSKLLNFLPKDKEDEFFYTQGYNLGERLFYAYSLGQIDKKYIQKILTNSCKTRGSVLKQFRKLRKDLWQLENYF